MGLRRVLYWTLELLAEVADLEDEVVRLEEQVVQFRQDLYKEAIYISSSNRNLENSTDFEEKFPSRDDLSNKPTLSKPPIELCTKHRINKQQSKSRKIDRVKTISKRYPVDYMSADKCLDSRRMQFEGRGIDAGEMGKTTFSIHEKGSLGDDAPNKISESILKCLMFVFSRICSTSALKVREMVPSLTPCENPWEMDFKDPYEIFYEFENTDIGPYKYLYEVEANIIDKNQTTISVSLAQKLKILLGKLESVSLTSLTHQEKLAFWINIYNSCMMNAILKHGIPETPERVEQLMQEANINVGGYLLNAFSIEHSILRLPYNKKYTSEKAFKNDEFTARSIFGIECAEPLVTFALSCGSWSSPAVKVYTGAEVKNELEDAKRDYLQAAVGISTTKKQLSIPKLLDWYMLDFAKDMETFLDWVCLQLPSEIGNVAMKCLERKMSEPLSDCVQVRPYKFHFRYLLYK